MPSLSVPTREDTAFSELLDSLSGGADGASGLVALLREDHPCYAGRGATAVNRMRARILERLAERGGDGMPESVLPFLLEELESGSDAFLMAHASRTLRACSPPRPEFAAPLLDAVRRVRYADENVVLDGRPTSAVAELLESLAWLGPEAAAVRQEVQALGAELPKKHRAALERALQRMASGTKAPDCCAQFGFAGWRSSARRNAGTIAAVAFEDQDGVPISFAEYFRGKPAIVVFFYTRCDNPLKCSLSITNLGVVQRLLEERGLSDAIRTAAITYDPAFDLPARLRAYGRERGLRSGANHRMLRAPEDVPALREYFQLGVNFVESVVNRHRIELFVLDREGRVAAAFERVRWDAAQVVDKAVEVAREAAPAKAGAGLLGSAASVGLALLPKCPACWAAYLGMAGASGLPASSLAALQPLLIAFLLFNVVMGIVRARRTGRFGPLSLVVAGAVAMLCWCAGADWARLRDVGIVLTLAGSIWSVTEVRR